MRVPFASRTALVLVVASAAACGAKSELHDSDAQGTSTSAASGASTASASVGAGGGGGQGGADVAPAQCLCPDVAGFAPCVKPEECCPVVGRCKDPGNFNCTGSAISCADLEPD